MKRDEQVYDEVATRFGDSDSSVIIELVTKAVIAKGIKLGQLNLPSAQQNDYEDVVRRVADLSAYERDFSTILSILPRNDELQGPGIHALVVFSARLGPKRALELIQNSPAAELLLPLVTALQQELGLKPRVAREVEEVAQDVRSKLTALLHSSNVEWPGHD